MDHWIIFIIRRKCLSGVKTARWDVKICVILAWSWPALGQSLYFLSKIRDITVIYWEKHGYSSQIHLNSNPGRATFQLRIWASSLLSPSCFLICRVRTVPRTSQAVRRRCITVYSEPGPLAFLPLVSSASNPFSVKVSEWPFCSFSFKSVCLVFKMWNMCIVLKKRTESYNGKNESLISHCFSALASILCVCVCACVCVFFHTLEFTVCTLL